jgi:hypothetical protein
MPSHALSPWFLALVLALVFGLAALSHAFAAPQRVPARAVMRLDRPGDLDLQAVAFAQADAALEAWGPGARGLAAPFVRRSGTFESFLRQGYAALYAPTARHEACLGRAPLVLGSGCESCWLWPDLAADLFFTHSTAWSLDGQGGR